MTLKPSPDLHKTFHLRNTNENLRTVELHQHFVPGGGGGAGLLYKNDGDAGRKYYIYPLKETNLGVARDFFDPLEIPLLNSRQERAT